jgi:hypothetical protein
LPASKANASPRGIPCAPAIPPPALPARAIPALGFAAIATWATTPPVSTHRPRTAFAVRASASPRTHQPVPAAAMPATPMKPASTALARPVPARSTANAMRPRNGIRRTSASSASRQLRR